MVVLLDTSVWVDHLQGASSRAGREAGRLLRADVPELVTCDPVVMEMLAGARDEKEVGALEPITDGLRLLTTEPPDFRMAGDVYRSLRRAGRTVRSQVDCLIAAIVVRHAATLWHKDADFVAIADVVALDHLDLR